MRWPFRRRTPPTGGAEAHERAAADLADQRSRQPEVVRVAASLRELRERNHFAEQVRQIFLGGTLDERN